MTSRDIYLKVVYVWDVTPCSLVEMYRRFREEVKFYTQDSENLKFRFC
jgi:hypothetical protein